MERLQSIPLSEPLIIVATGKYVGEGFADYRMPFYDAFRVFHIPELEHEDLADILPILSFYCIISGNPYFFSSHLCKR